MAFFNVLPGASYHAVQEVQSASPRMSIQGWYHAHAPPPDAERASLSLLQALNADDPAQGSSLENPNPREQWEEGGGLA